MLTGANESVSAAPCGSAAVAPAPVVGGWWSLHGGATVGAGLRHRTLWVCGDCTLMNTTCEIGLELNKPEMVSEY